MEFYRFRFIGEHAQSVSEQRLQAVDDREALELAQLLSDPFFGIEVWLDERRVGMSLPEKLGRTG